MKHIIAVGTGPGASEYLTLQAIRVLKSADVVFSPENAGKHLALDTAREFITAERIIPLIFTMGSVTEHDYRKAALTILDNTPDGKTGAVLTIGDPMFYSTFANMLPYLRRDDAEVRIVSGVPSFVAAAGISATPLAYTKETCTVTDHLNETILRNTDAIALLKTGKQKTEALGLLEKHGFDYVYVRRATLENQLVLTSAQKADIEADADYISLLLARKTKPHKG